MNEKRKIFGWSGRAAVLGLAFAAAAAGLQGVDYDWTVWLGGHRWPALVDFMGRTLFEGQAFGGGDVVVIFLLAAVFGYYRCLKRPGGRLHALRADLGFVFSSAIVWGLGLVHALKWSMGRARPFEVLYTGAPFTPWYGFGPHFVTEGIYRGSFPSGHTAQAALLLTLTYVLSRGAEEPARWSLPALGWGAFSLCYVAAMGLARCMALSHWLTDVLGGLFLTWIGMHLMYGRLLRVPDQKRFFWRAGRWPKGPDAWELRLSAWLLTALAGGAALVLGGRALTIDGAAPLALLIVPGAAALWGGIVRTAKLRQKVFAEMDEADAS